MARLILIEEKLANFLIDEDAINKALELLNVSREEVTIKVVAEEQKGLFGMEGVKPAKVKVFRKQENDSK